MRGWYEVKWTGAGTGTAGGGRWDAVKQARKNEGFFSFVCSATTTEAGRQDVWRPGLFCLVSLLVGALAFQKGLLAELPGRPS